MAPAPDDSASLPPSAEGPDAEDPRQAFERSADLLRALAEAQRLQIITLLISGPKCVGELAERVGHEMAKVSHHLGVLRQSHLVTTTKRGRHVEYALHPDCCIAQRDGAEFVLRLGLVRFALPLPPPTVAPG